MVEISRIEASIRKKYHGEIFSRFAKAINAYALLEAEDKVAVCIRSGEFLQHDILIALLFKEIQRHRKFEFSIEIILTDSDCEDVLKNLNLDYKKADTACSDVSLAELFGCNKVTAPYTYEDATESILSNMINEGCVKTLMPRQKTDNDKINVICPLYLIRDEDIRHWCRYVELGFERPESTDDTALLIQRLQERNQYIEGNIFKSVENVNIHTIISYTENGVAHDFHEWYDDYKRKWGNDRDE